jgi:hypothetical protein
MMNKTLKKGFAYEIKVVSSPIQEAGAFGDVNRRGL